MKIWIFILILLVIPFVYAEITQENLEKSFQVYNRQILDELDKRDTNTENKIDIRYEGLKLELQNTLKLGLFKFGVVLVTSSLIAFLGIYSMLYWLQKNKLNILSKKYEIIKKGLKDGITK